MWRHRDYMSTGQHHTDQFLITRSQIGNSPYPATTLDSGDEQVTATPEPAFKPPQWNRSPKPPFASRLQHRLLTSSRSRSFIIYILFPYSPIHVLVKDKIASLQSSVRVAIKIISNHHSYPSCSLALNWKHTSPYISTNSVTYFQWQQQPMLRCTLQLPSRLNPAYPPSQAACVSLTSA